MDDFVWISGRCKHNSHGGKNASRDGRRRAPQPRASRSASGSTPSFACRRIGAVRVSGRTLIREERLKNRDELEREIEVLAGRIAALSAAVMRLGSSLELATVLQEVADSARLLTRVLQPHRHCRQIRRAVRFRHLGPHPRRAP